MTNATSRPLDVRLAQFIAQEMEAILAEWESFARTRIPAATTMSLIGLRDHAESMLRAISIDMYAAQTEPERETKAKGLALPLNSSETAATEHGALRHIDGFDLVQVASEFRALRAAVLRLWKVRRANDAQDIEDITRFNEGIDQALAESIAAYSWKIRESRDTFLAVLGHDLRGPLGALSNCVQLLQRPDIAQATSERMFHVATRSVESMSGLITDLLEYTRTRLGQGIKVVTKEGDFGAICLEVIEEARAGHPTRTFTYTRSGALTVLFDADRMRQVLGNLLNNAVQHGDASSRIDVDVSEERSYIRLAVANRGESIPAEALQVIFNPLVQVAKTNTEPHERQSTSMGLGLFIAMEIVKAHLGSVAVTSSPDTGTVFTVRLPKGGPAV